MIPLAIAAALLLQQQVPQRGVPAGGNFDSVQTASRQAIMDVGRSVAEMRTAHEALRRAVFNSSDGMVLQQAQEMRRSCQDLTAVARAASPRLCRRCFGASAQRAINAYRAILPSVSQVGTRCASQLTQRLRANGPAGAVKRSIWALSRTVVEGLWPYEARVQGVRRAFNLHSPPQPARR
jgi:hypothetical protein